MSTYRIEEDCLGQIKVEADKYWKSQTQRSLENFKIGQELMPASLIHSFAKPTFISIKSVKNNVKPLSKSVKESKADNI